MFHCWMDHIFSGFVSSAAGLVQVRVSMSPLWILLETSGPVFNSSWMPPAMENSLPPSVVSTQSVAWLCVLISVTHEPHEASVEQLTWGVLLRLSHTLVPMCLRSSAVHSLTASDSSLPSLSPKGAEFSFQETGGIGL